MWLMLFTILRMGRSRYLVALALVTAVVIPVATGAAAQQSTQQQLQQQASETGAAEQSARDQLVQAQAERQRLDASLTSVTSQLAAANSRVAAAQADVDRLTFASMVLEGKATATRAKLEQAKHDVRRSAVLLYQHNDGAEMIGLLDGTNGSGQIVEGKQYLHRVSDKRQDDARRVTKLQSELAAEHDQIAQQQQTADAARAAANDEKAKLDALAAQQAQARDAASAAEENEGAKLDAARTQHDQAEAALQEESDRIAQQIQSQSQTSAESPALGNGTFIWPVSGPITSPFGYRTDPVTGATAFHAGIDIGASCGTPIKAAGTGVILEAGFNSGGYGNMTLINHGAGLSTLYGHQSSIIVSVGQSVTQGQVIGYVGSTGKSTGCHLHFEVRVNGNPVDPLGYL
jgi:murein DD-endopeptidase MepM/ murein hydrolase activator NlpD